MFRVKIDEDRRVLGVWDVQDYRDEVVEDYDVFLHDEEEEGVHGEAAEVPVGDDELRDDEVDDELHGEEEGDELRGEEEGDVLEVHDTVYAGFDSCEDSGP